MTDIEIARNSNKLVIRDVAKKIGLENDIEEYGLYKAKIIKNVDSNKKGKLVLVTAINPTPYGEGKTTVSIGLTDGLCKLGINAGAVLREPSLGPVFGVKGGATGGGYSQVVPMEDINLHFTGDFHAITSANNLLASVIDNHIFQGNELGIEVVRFKRCLDVNDRSLRSVSLNGRFDSFQITSASEIMATFCLSRDLMDLKKSLGDIIVGYTKENNPVFVKDLHVEGALAALLKDAFKPNLVQTLENNPVIIHGGPFANIAHGCNSVVATNLGVNLFDYVVTEAGFGADLGAEKFMDIKCRKAGLAPDVVVLVVTIKALKYHGDDLANLEVHIENLKKFGVNIVVALNKFEQDSLEDIERVREFCLERDIEFSVTTSYKDGGDGSIDLANKVINLSNKENSFKFIYADSDTIFEKIEKVATNIYHASKVNYSDVALGKINNLKEFEHYSICVAKTPMSISDDPKKLGYPKDYEIFVRDIDILNGCGMIVVYLNDIMTMPGLSKNPSYLNIDVDDDGNIVGIF